LFRLALKVRQACGAWPHETLERIPMGLFVVAKEPIEMLRQTRGERTNRTDPFNVWKHLVPEKPPNLHHTVEELIFLGTVQFGV
jgi:hypothetical protein